MWKYYCRFESFGFFKIHGSVGNNDHDIAYGALAGNLALLGTATGGLYLGGGIAPKILPALTTGAFMRTFLAKPPLDPMLAAMPVKVILNAEAGLLGAAVFAAERR